VGLANADLHCQEEFMPSSAFLNVASAVSFISAVILGLTTMSRTFRMALTTQLVLQVLTFAMPFINRETGGFNWNGFVQAINKHSGSGLLSTHIND
jgi:putative Mn2+ efflux pump MntP